MNVNTILSSVPGVPAREGVNQKARVLSELLRADGHEITEFGVRQWFARNKIPAVWLGRVTTMARKTSPKFDPFTIA